MVNRRSFLLASAVTAATAQTDGDTAGTGMIGVGNRGAYLLEAAMAQPRARILASATSSPIASTKRLPPPRAITPPRIRTGAKSSTARTSTPS